MADQRCAAPPRGAAAGPRRRAGRRHAGGALQHPLDLPDAPFPEALRLTDDFDEAVAYARPQGLVIIGTPMAALGGMSAKPACRRCGLVAVQGLRRSGRLGNEIAAQALRLQARNGVLPARSAHEVALGQPTALVAASTDTALAEQAVAAFHSDSLRVDTSTDPIGVEVGGAVKKRAPLPPALPMA